MPRVYWRPKAVSRSVVLLLSLLSLLGLAAVELLQTNVRQPNYEQKLAAARLAAQAMELLKEERLTRGHVIDPDLDPANSGMIGDLMTLTTTVPGNLPAKQTSLNPNFAAVIVELLKQAGLQPGDSVAVGCSGSFPALNVSVCAALETLELKPIIISSAGASQFGANFPDFLWIDMERNLFEQGLISFRSDACSIGGYEDLGTGMTDQARDLVLSAIDRNQLQLIKAAEMVEAIDERMRIYRERAKGQTIKAYINVGGGLISVGGTEGKKVYRPGLNLQAPRGALQVDCVMTRFMRQGTPAINLVQVNELAEQYELPLAPDSLPPIGEGSAFVKREYNRWLAGGILVLILIGLRTLLFTDIGVRLLKGRGTSRQRPHAEPMV